MIRGTAVLLAAILCFSPAVSADPSAQKRAAKEARRSLRLAERQYGAEDLHVADCLDRLGQIYLTLAKPALAQPLFSRALAIRRKKLGRRHPIVAENLIILARIYYLDQQPEEAAQAAEEARSIQEETLSGPGGQPKIIAKTLILLAEIYVSQGHPEKAEPLAEKAVEAFEPAEQPEDPIRVDSLTLLARIRLELGKKGTGGQAAVQSVEPWVSSSPEPEKPASEFEPAGKEIAANDRWLNVAHSMRNQAEVYKKLGRRVQADQLLREALEVYEKVFGQEFAAKEKDLPTEDRWLAVARELRGQAKSYVNLGRGSQAKRLFQETLEIYEKILGPKYPEGEAIKKEYEEFLTKASG